MRNPFLSKKPLVLLALLQDGQPHAAQQIVELAAGKLRRGTVLTWLGRLNLQGFIASRVERESMQRVPRVFYTLTESGRRLLENADPAQRAIAKRDDSSAKMRSHDESRFAGALQASCALLMRLLRLLTFGAAGRTRTDTARATST